jgi:hypothetical protein
MKFLAPSSGLCLALLSACQIDPVELGEGGTIGSGDGETQGDGDGDGDGACEPRDPELSLSLGFHPGADPDLNLDWSCTIVNVDVSSGMSLLLDCPDVADPLNLSVDVTPGFVAPVSGGETIQLRYQRWSDDGGVDEFLRIDVDGVGHLLTWVDAFATLSSFPIPFAIEFMPTPCEPIEEFCGPATRHALAFEVDGETVEVLDGSHAAFGGLDVWVFEAWEVPDDVNSCTDAPWRRVHALFVDAG